MLTRPPIKHSRIISELRAEIVSGIFAPGAQLPTRETLERRFAASRVTIQRALDELVRDGFVHARGRFGTFVAEHPPHLSRIGLVFHRRPAKDGTWSRFWTAMRNEAAVLSQGALPRITPYYGPEAPNDESFLQLTADVRSHRLAGLIFATAPRHLEGSAPLEEPGLPRVAIMSERLFDVPTVDVNAHSFVDKALDYLRERHRKRIAVMLGSQRSVYRDYLLKGIARRGMRCEPYWLQGISPDAPEPAANCAHLLVHKNQTLRPDGLIVADDNLVEHATAGLVAAGLHVPEDADVVVHCNFPWPTPSVLPVKRLGYDIRQLIQVCIEILAVQREGKRPSEVTLLPALFENEMAH